MIPYYNLISYKKILQEDYLIYLIWFKLEETTLCKGIYSIGKFSEMLNGSLKNMNNGNALHLIFTTLSLNRWKLRDLATNLKAGLVVNYNFFSL